MVTAADHKLDERIHSFLDRKMQKFPELDRIEINDERTSLLTRVQDMVTTMTHTRSARHTH